MAKKYGYEAFLEDQKKREQEEKKGQVRYVEAAKASRIQYTLPQYKGKSENQGKTYQWERDTMANTKVKGAGNSYTKKFNALTKRMGMTDGQASEFRKYMDFQEDSQHVDPKMNKDGSINQSQSLNYARDAHTQNDVINGILDNMTSRNKQFIKDGNAQAAKNKKAAKKAPKLAPSQKEKLSQLGALGYETPEPVQNDKYAAANAVLSGEKSIAPGKYDAANDVLSGKKSMHDDRNALEKVMDFLNSPLKAIDEKVLRPAERFATSFTDGLTLGQLKKNVDKNDTPEFVRQASEEPTNKADKAIDMVGEFAGMTAPIGAAYKPAGLFAKAVMGGKEAKYLEAAARGGAAMGMYSTAQQGIDEVTNPEDGDFNSRTKNVLLNTGLGALGDPALLLAGAGLKAGASNVLGRMAKVDGELPTYTGQASDSVLDSLAPNRQGNINQSPEDLYNQLIQKANPGVKDADEAIAQALTQKQVAEDQFVRQEMFNPKGPNPNFISGNKDLEANIREQFNRTPQARQIDDLINQLTGQRENALNATNEPPVINDWRSKVQEPAPVSMEGIQPRTDVPINNWQDNIVKNSQAPEEVLESLTRPETNPAAPKISTEKDFIDQELAPYRESAQKQSEAQQTWEKVVKGAKEDAQRIKNYYGKIVPDGNSKDMINEIPPQFRAAKSGKGNDIYSFAEEEGFANADEAIAYLKQIDLDSKMKLKDLMPEDSYVLSAEEWDMLEQVARQKYAETHGGKQPSDNVLDQLIQNEVPKAETEATKPETAPASEVPTQGADNLLMRLDSQTFNGPNSRNALITTDKPIASKSAIESINNPIKRKLNKFYENAINSTHSAKVAHVQVLERAIKNAKSTSVRQPKKVKMLEDQLKSVKKNGSDLEKSIQNQAAAGNKAKTFLDGHMDNLQKVLGSTKPEDMAEAIRYQVAKNIRWIWDNVNPDYEVGGGWDKGRINTIVNSGIGNPKLQAFTDSMKKLTQERLDLSLKHGLINKNAHTALSKNPFYIPMARDVTPGMDNVGRSLKEGTTKNKGKAGAYFIQSLGDGDAEALYKDPLESLMTGTFSMFKNIAKEDTHKQLYNIAKLDSDKLFTRMVSKKEFDSKGGIAVPTPKGTKYIQIQDDLHKMIQENDLPYDLNVLGKVTSAFAGLKTRSLEYHMTGVPRDLAEGYLKGQINNPVKYLSELVKAAKEHNLSAKQAGAYFDRAYKDGMNGINQEQMMKEYARQNGNVKPFNPKDKESWKELTSTILRIADMPFKPIKALGQLSDELPRTVEVKATQKAFTKQHGAKLNNIKKALDQVNSKIESASQATDPFDPALQGIDKLKGQKSKLENMLNEYDKNLEREQTFRGRDIMNFSRAGRGGVAKHIRQYAIFANTTTQSKDKLVRSFIERPGATIGKVALLTAPLVYAEHVMHQNLSEGDKKIWDNLPTWAKQFNYVYVHNGSVYTVPKVQELALLTNPIEAILAGNKEDLNASARLAVKETVPYQVGNFAQGLVPNTDGSTTIRKNAQVPSTVFSPALDVAANDKLGFNRNAISFADKFGRQDAKANKFTLDAFKKTFGNKARADYAQYLATQYPGDAGKYGAHILDWLLEPGNNDKLDAMLQNLNPLQDRIYSKDGEVLGHKVVKNPPKKPAVKK